MLDIMLHAIYNVEFWSGVVITTLIFGFGIYASKKYR